MLLLQQQKPSKSTVGTSTIRSGRRGKARHRRRRQWLRPSFQGQFFHVDLEERDQRWQDIHWVDLRENQQETIDFPMKYGIFL